ncbi:MAG TPA: enoyl-CoA hydratase [Azospirillaceae bacterium]|nr:enoyl-CoA hydratase [Azospirillaceae bacterium]
MTAAPKPLDHPVLRADEGGVAVLTLNRPDARNALSRALMQALQEQLDAIGADPAIRVVVLRGAGPVFSSGHDLKELRSIRDRDALVDLFRQCAMLMQTIVGLRQPVIAQVHGVATAAGCQLVATCDLAVAADDARFATPGVNIGLFCSTPMVALTRAVGAKASMEMLLTGDMVDAGTAVRIGLVNRCVPAVDLEAETMALAGRIASKSARTVAIGKAAFHRQREMDLAGAYAYTAEVMAANMAAEDAAEGIDAFLGKRPAVWKHC